MTQSVDGGGGAGSNLPSPKNYALELAHDVASRAGLTDLGDRATLMLRKPGEISYQDNRFGDGAESAVQNAALLGKVTRTGAALIPNWSFRSGTKVGVLRVASDDELRWNEPPEDEYASGPLIETSAGTNKNRNPLFLNARLGLLSASGVLPTHMSVTGLADTAVEVVAFGRIDNWPFIRLRLNGTPSADPRIIFEASTAIDAVATDDVCVQHGVAINAGDLTNITSLQSIIHERAENGDSELENIETFTPTAEHLRFFYGVELSDAQCAHVTHEIGVDWDGSGAIDITLDIYLPDLKIGSLEPSSPVIPSTDAVDESSRGAETRNGGFESVRASGKSNAGEWDFVSGSRVGPLRFYDDDAPAMTSKGILSEGASSNQIRNPRFVGIAPQEITGTTVLAHGITIAGTITAEILEVGTINGWPYLDLEVTTFSGTPLIYFEESGKIAATTAVNPDQTLQVGLQLLSGSLEDVTISLSWANRDSGGGQTANIEQSPRLGPDDIDGTPRRFSFSQTVAQGTTAYVQPRLLFRTTGTPSPFTIRIFAPQNEPLPHPTSLILPAEGSYGVSTRAADDIQFANGNWALSGHAGALYVEAIPAASGSSEAAIEFGADSSNRVYGGTISGNKRVFINSGGSTVAIYTGSAAVAGEVFQLGVAFKADDFAMSINGEAQHLDTAGAVPTGAPDIAMGRRLASGANNFHGYITQVSYWPSRLADAGPEALVGNS